MEIRGCNVILHGNFEPSMFHPSWIFHHGVESEEFANSFQLDIFSNDSAKYKINMTEYLIERNKFSISREDDRLVDLFKNKLTILFCDLVPHIPIHNISILKYTHMMLSNHNQWVKLYNNLTPIKKFNNFSSDVKNSNENSPHGLYNLQLCASEEMDNCNFVKFITIGRSHIFKDNFGVYVSEEFQYFDNSFQRVENLVQISKNEIDNREKEAEDIFKTIREII